jgi:hypothetical protein
MGTTQFGHQPAQLLWVGIQGDHAPFSVIYRDTDLTGFVVQAQFRNSKSNSLIADLSTSNSRIGVSVVGLDSKIDFMLNPSETVACGADAVFDIQLTALSGQIRTDFVGKTRFQQQVTL